MKKEFVRLCLLQDVDKDCEYITAEQQSAWVANVLGTVGAEGYAFAGSDGLDTAEFSCDEMEFADVAVYDYIGSEYEAERFYVRDIVTFKHKATSEYYVLNAEDLLEF
jgi:hypothetical protein